MKSYTDLEQSKKLVEILPLESADMCYYEYTSHIDGTPKVGYKEGITEGIPCWSLAALLDILPTIDDEFEPQLHRSSDKYLCTYEGKEDSSGLWRVADNPVDACVNIITKLHELKML